MRPTLIALTALLLPCKVSAQQARNFPLESAAGLRVHNVTAEAVTLDGKRGVRLTVSPELTRRLQALTPDQLTQFAQRGSIDGVDLEQLAVIEGSDFSSGVIEAEIAGALAPDAGAGARGFVGIGFRVQPTCGPMTPSISARPTAAPKIKSGAIMPRSTSRIPIGRGSGCARSRPAGMSRTWISCQAYGPRSRSTCAATKHGSTSTTIRSPPSSSTM